MPKTDITVRELVDKVQRGELTLPEMQRPYVWKAARVRDLLDSLYRGYPSGTILTWETDEDIESRTLAVNPSRSPINSTRLLLLDGQQRTTSLAAILSGQPVTVRDYSRPIEILFNLDHPEGPPAEVLEVNDEDEPSDPQDVQDEEDGDDDETDIQEEMKIRTFVVASKALKNNPVWVPVSDIFKKSDRDILRPMGINSDDERWDKYAKRLQKVRDIEKYPYVMQVLEKNLSYEEVTEIFVRVNSLGIKLRGSDLALAQITSKWKGFLKTTEEFAEQFDDDEKYILDSGIPVRTLVVFATHQSRFKTVGTLSEAKLRSAWEKAKEALEFSINFVRSNAGVEHLDYLSSPMILITIGVFAVLKEGKLTANETKMLQRWLHIAHTRAHYSTGSSESILDADLSLLFKGRDLNDLTQQLLQHVKKFELDAAEVRGRNIRNPIFSMLYHVLRQNDAKDWLSGLSISDKHTGRTHKIQYHHIFPRALLKKAGYEPKDINQVANMAFIGGRTNRQIQDREPIDYFQEVVIPKQGEAALISQLIPTDKALWKLEAYPQFIEWRSRAIAEAVNGYLRQYV